MHAVPVRAVAFLLAMSALGGCYAYDEYEGRVSNHDPIDHWYDIRVYVAAGDVRAEFWHKSLRVGPFGTSFLGGVARNEGNYTIDVTMDNQTHVRESRPFDRNEGPGFFQISTRDGNVTIEFGFV